MYDLLFFMGILLPKADVGSSSSKIFGLDISALAMATL